MISQFSEKPKVFLSYRRGDSSGHSGRIYDDLVDAFGEKYVKIDVDMIRGGDDFEATIEKEICSSQVLLVIIGNQWLTISENEKRRIDLPKDLVKKEILLAFSKGIPVIPVLVQGAKMPTTDDLPDELKKLNSIHYVEVTDSRWHYDIGVLINTLKKYAPRRISRRKAFITAAIIFSFLVVFVVLESNFFSGKQDLFHEETPNKGYSETLTKDRESTFFKLFDSLQIMQEITQQKVIAAKLNLRVWPIATSSIIRYIEKDVVVKVYHYHNGWALVTVPSGNQNGQDTGFVIRQFLQ